MCFLPLWQAHERLLQMMKPFSQKIEKKEQGKIEDTKPSVRFSENKKFENMWIWTVLYGN